MLSLPGAANHPDLKAQIDFIKGNKDTVRVAQAKEFAGMKARFERLTVVGEQSKKAVEEHRKKEEELNAPPAALDGSALGKALLKNLGFK